MDELNKNSINKLEENKEATKEWSSLFKRVKKILILTLLILVPDVGAVQKSVVEIVQRLK